jgi:hypothetical protein
MPSQEEIADQQDLLALHRRRLADQLRQWSTLDDADAPPGLLADIRDTRDKIGRAKSILRGWGMPVEDHPDDEPLGGAALAPAPAGAAQGAPRARVFISYKHVVDPDESIALQVYHALNRQHDVFIDQTILVGTRWAEQIETELRRADFLIVFLSAQSVHSEMVMAEISTAHHLAKTQDGRPGILPVRLAYRAPFQYPLSAYLDPINWVFWDGPQDTPRLIDELLRAIAGGVLPIDDRSKLGLLQIGAAQLPQPTPSAQVAVVRGPAQLEMPEGTMDPSRRSMSSDRPTRSRWRPSRRPG